MLYRVDMTLGGVPRTFLAGWCLAAAVACEVVWVAGSEPPLVGRPPACGRVQDSGECMTENIPRLRGTDLPLWLGSQCGVEEAFGQPEQVCGRVCFLSVSSMSEEDGGAADGLLEM